MSAADIRKPFYLLFVFLCTTVWAGTASDVSTEAAGPLPNPRLALGRHFAAATPVTWSTETVEIEASLPNLAEHGRLRAIRRVLPFSRPEYEVLAMDGERTVRQQVIARYLSAEAEAASLSPASVAITPANYRFQHIASISDGRTLTHIYEITPRKKKAGLIKGQIWIDAETGTAVRQTGYLVRTPSIFVRRISMTRDTLLHDGVAYAKRTHVEIDTRLVGRANLIITERPYSPKVSEQASAKPR